MVRHPPVSRLSAPLGSPVDLIELGAVAQARNNALLHPQHWQDLRCCDAYQAQAGGPPRTPPDMQHFPPPHAWHKRTFEQRFLNLFETDGSSDGLPHRHGLGHLAMVAKEHLTRCLWQTATILKTDLWPGHSSSPGFAGVQVYQVNSGGLFRQSSDVCPPISP